MHTRRVLAALVVMGVVLCVLGQWADPPDATLAVPVGSGRAVHVKAWSMWLLDADPDRSFRTRWMGIWYQRRPGGTLIYVAAWRLPVWPLIILPIGMSLALAAVTIRRPRR